MARRPISRRTPTVLTASDLQAHHRHLPKSRHGHPFAPDPVPPGFHTIIDPDKNPPQPWRDLPPPTGLPPFRMDLASILDKNTMAKITKNKKLVFHAVGDTGGVNTPTYIEGVTRFMESDFHHAPDAADIPSFFYHLGDVVYYDGESANYWPEFYEPYLGYHAPIVAIPGNHDGDVNPSTGESSLQAFVRNFCAQSAVISPDNRDAPRRTMTQPNVFWTLNTPLVTIIGLYSNCPEGVRSERPSGSGLSRNYGRPTSTCRSSSRFIIRSILRMAHTPAAPGSRPFLMKTARRRAGRPMRY